MSEINEFFWQIKLKKKIKSNKYANFGRKLGKLASHLKMNIIKIGKTSKSEEFMIIGTFPIYVWN